MEKKRLIPAYNSKDKVTEKYIKETTRTNNPLQVKRILFNFKNAYAKEQVVCDVIDKIIYNEKLLNKVAIVSDLSYGSCAIIISSNVVTTPHTGGYSSINPQYTYTELLKYFEEKAEKIFILLDDEVKKKNNNIKPTLIFLEDKSAIKIEWATIDPILLVYNTYSVNDINNNIPQLNIDDMTKKDWDIISLKGELSAINNKINECLDVSLIDNCEEKKYFYNTMFNQLCKEKEKILNKLNNIKNT
jgi:hypothetical protein